MNNKNEVYDRVIEFMKANQISSSETIYQCDWVMENSLEFIDDLFELVKTYLPETFNYNKIADL
jgi:hypothetical protein